MLTCSILLDYIAQSVSVRQMMRVREGLKKNLPPPGLHSPVAGGRNFPHFGHHAKSSHSVSKYVGVTKNIGVLEAILA